MARTTVNIDPVLLRELKRRSRRENKSLGQVMSELLAGALDREEDDPARELHWTTGRMGARVDLEDKEALHRLLEER